MSEHAPTNISRVIHSDFAGQVIIEYGGTVKGKQLTLIVEMTPEETEEMIATLQLTLRAARTVKKPS